jgi:hypothetical protein
VKGLEVVEVVGGIKGSSLDMIGVDVGEKKTDDEGEE